MDILSPTGEKIQLLPFNYETDLLNSLKNINVNIEHIHSYLRNLH